MAWDFVTSFARDEGLQVHEACGLRPGSAPSCVVGKGGCGLRAWACKNDKGPHSGPLITSAEGLDQAAAIALTLADSRLLWRAALFL